MNRAAYLTRFVSGQLVVVGIVLALWGNCYAQFTHCCRCGNSPDDCTASSACDVLPEGVDCATRCFSAPVCQDIADGACTGSGSCAPWTPTPTTRPTATRRVTLTPTVVPTQLPRPCCGDCNGDRIVTVDELVTAVNYLLTGCPGE